MKNLLPRVIERAQELGWNVGVDVAEDGKLVEFSQYSPNGEDFSFLATVKKDNDLVETVYEEYEYFDPDEHAVSWYKEGRGLQTLLDDANAIKDMLQELYFAVYEISGMQDDEAYCPHCKQTVHRKIEIAKGFKSDKRCVIWTCPECGVVEGICELHTEVDREDYYEVYSGDVPDGWYLIDTGIEVIGMIVTDGELEYEEEFTDKEDCIEWFYRKEGYLE